MSNARIMDFDPDIDIQVLDGVYEPAEDSHLLLEAVKVEEGMRVLEVGTGSGLIALHCARAGGMVVATDIDSLAVKCSHDNAERNGIVLDIILTDLAKGVVGEFDVIVFNPPYLNSERQEVLSDMEREQLVGGPEGWEISVRFLEMAAERLSEDGRIYLLTSSESERGIMENAIGQYNIYRAASKRIFFEELSVLVLSR